MSFPDDHTEQTQKSDFGIYGRNRMVNRSKKSAYTDADIERMCGFVAWLIELYGDEYWPVLDWLEDELAERKRKRERLERWRKPAEKNPTALDLNGCATKPS
jgi:hypothetical protein